MASRANLPLPPTPLLGREPEVAAIDNVLSSRAVRLLTLTGPPGVGKTRLALAAAEHASARFSDAVVFVDLTPVRSPDAVVAEVARAVGLAHTREQPLAARLATWLSRKDLLLVVDNFEHVLPAAPDLAALLRKAPNTSLLVTSRERLHMAAEHEFPVPPLPMPRRNEITDLQQLTRNPSVALLLDRARALLPAFAVTADNAQALVEICIRLDGIPLAIELAAARLKVFSAQDLVHRLESHLLLLTGGASDLPARHRTLRAAIEWSHDLLPVPERVLFRRASVLVGGWSVQAAEQVCGESQMDVLNGTSSLLDKNLIRRTTRPDGTVVFSMIEGLREYAAQQLLAHGEAPTTRARHAAYFAEHAGQAERGIGTVEETRAADWVGLEQGNLLAALDHCLDTGDIGLALRLAAGLGWYWYTRGRIGEGQAVLEQVLDIVDTASVPQDALAGALMISGILAWSSGDLDHARSLLERCAAATGPTGDVRRLAITEAFLGHVFRAAHQYDDAAARHLRAGELFERIHSERGVAWSRYDLGLLARDRGDVADARALFLDALRTFRDMDYPWAVAACAWGLGTVDVQLGRTDEAAPLLLESLDRFVEFDDWRGVAQSMEALAGVAWAQSMYPVAARLLAAATGLRATLDVPLPPVEAAAVRRIEHELSQVLDPRAFDQARYDGRTMPISAAVELARSLVTIDDESPRTPDPPLTRREHQVAALVARGKTNRQVARSLGIAEKTAEAHVYNIMSKLNAHSRAEVASWATAVGLLPSARPTSAGRA